MSTIGKVKSECTITSPKHQRTGTPGRASPGNSRIPVANANGRSPVTVIQAKKFVPRRKQTIGDAKSQLDFGSPVRQTVQDVVYHDAPEKGDAASLCDPVLNGKDASYPNCTFMNVCTERMRSRSRWRSAASRLGLIFIWIAQLVSLVVGICFTCSTTLNHIYWLLKGWATGWEEQNLPETPDTFFEEPEEETENSLVELSPKSHSLIESKHSLSLLDFLMQTLESIFGWIGNILLPADE